MGHNSSKELGDRNIKNYLADQKINFTEDKIKEMFKIYRSNCQSGNHLKISDFKSVYQRLFPGDSSAFAEHIFGAFDEDENGSIDFREFLIGFSMLSSTDVETKLDWIFRVYDINGDGAISEKEMMEILKSVCQMSTVITQQKGDIDSPEIMSKKLFERLDTNHDGEISREEFRIGAIKDRSILKLLMNFKL